MNENLNTNEWVERRETIEKVLREHNIYNVNVLLGDGGKYIREYSDTAITLLANQILRELGFKAISSSGKRIK